MTVLDLMKRRCSVRRFEDRPIEAEQLDYVLEAARVAPTACNLQPWRLIVVESKDLIRQIAPEWVGESGVSTLIVCCGDHATAWRRRDGKDHCDIDLAIVVDHMTLAAAEVGLGTCWICSFDAFACATLLELPNQLEPTVLLPIGHPAESKPADRHDQERKPTEDLVIWHPAPE